MNNKKPSPSRGILIYVLLFALVMGIIYIYQGSGYTPPDQAQVQEIEFSDLVSYLQEEQVASITVTEGSRRYEGTLKDESKFIAYAPTAYDMAIVSETYLVPQASGDLVVESVKPSSASSLLSWLPTLLLVGVMIFFWISLMNGGAGGGKGVMTFGKNRARIIRDADKKVTFKDVAGLDEEKNELEEIVDFLKDPSKYTELGARIPKGILLVGPPGTGKTYISKAVAGEAGVPFFSISGSDFVEMFVGVGASRVRDLFADAKKNSPCIVFIDEIDAVGRRRGAGIGGGNDEREQTLNQLLVEMDGFGVNEGIIILAATNRPDVLDPAILRPGRFDRQITISTPDIKGREAVFKVHSKNKPLDESVDIKTLAKRTPGFTPADIENVLNEAALLTARRNGTKIHMSDLEEAITRVIAGPEKKSRVISDKEKRLTAFHEAGHAIVMRGIPNGDPVHQITIMPRGTAGGFTMTLPTEDRWYTTKTDMMHSIMHLLGGRIAEDQELGDISTGASNDLERATKIAHDMVTKYGMSEAIGPINYSDADEVFLGRDFTSKQNFSEELAAKIDKEVRAIIDECYTRAENILKEHHDELTRVAEALLLMETLDGEQFEALYSGTKTAEEIQKESEEEAARREELRKKEAAEREKREAEKRESGILPEQVKRAKRVVTFDKDGNMIIKETVMNTKDLLKEQGYLDPKEEEEPESEEAQEDQDGDSDPENGGDEE